MAKLASYDAIVADIHLPDVGGYEAYRALREAQPGARVILMTGFGYDPTSGPTVTPAPSARWPRRRSTASTGARARACRTGRGPS